jgi:hypothetical protein
MEWASVNTESKKQLQPAASLWIEWEESEAAVVLIRRTNFGDYEKEQHDEIETCAPIVSPGRCGDAGWL